jgi:DNA-binding CsgD family transcriptional regulator
VMALSAGSVVVLGPAGVGKTRLLREVAARVERAGHPVRWIIGSPLVQHVALGAVTEFLPAETVGAEPAVLAAHARGALVRRDGETIPVVFVDDAHLLDAESAAIVQQLCLSRSAAVVCAARSQVRAPMITSLCRDDRTTVLELQPLGPDDVARLLADVLGGPVQPSTASLFYERSAGGALFLRELVEDARRSRVLRREPGGWAVDRDWTPGTRLLELVHTRSQRHDEQQNVALEIVAVGEPVSLGVLLALVPDEAVERLERDRLLEVRQDGRRHIVTFAHPLYGEASRARVASLATRRHRLRLADAVEATGARRRGDLLAIALWRLDGGELEPGEWLLAAQRSLALRHQASTALAERATSALRTAAAWTVLGQARTVERDLKGAMAAFDMARAAAETDHDVASVAAARANSAFWVGQEVDGVVDGLIAAEAVVRDAASRAVLAAQRVSILVNSGRTREGVTLADELVTSGLLEPAIQRWIQLVAANGLSFLGETRRARSIAEGLMAEPVPPSSSLMMTGSAATNLIIADLLGGDLRSADELLQLAGDLVQDPENAGFVAALHGRVALWQGKPTTALGRLDRGRDGLATGMSPWRSTWCDALRAEAAALTGLPSQAVRLVLGPTNEIAHRFLALDTLRSEAARRAATGDLPGARADLRDAAREAAAHELHAAALLANYERFRLRDPDAAAELLTLADQVDGLWSVLCAAHVGAWEAEDPAALEAAAARFADAGMTLYAAECAADAAAVAERAGRATAGRRASALAEELRRGCEGCWSPRLGAVVSMTPLTEREHEIALMAAAGLSNREIADQLTVGVRTVEGHLLRIYAKVAVRNRHELAELFGSGTRRMTAL